MSNAFLVFKTSVDKPVEVRRLEPLLQNILQHNSNWDFDLEDCDHILRVKCTCSSVTAVVQVLQTAGYTCEELPD